jgi:hypothetical protein
MEVPGKEMYGKGPLRRGERRYMALFAVSSVIAAVIVSVFLREFDLRILLLPPLPLLGYIINDVYPAAWIAWVAWSATAVLACLNVALRKKRGGLIGEFLAEERRYWQPVAAWSPARRVLACLHFGVARLNKHFYPSSSVVVGAVTAATYQYAYLKMESEGVLRLRYAFFRFILQVQRVAFLTLIFVSIDFFV